MMTLIKAMLNPEKFTRVTKLTCTFYNGRQRTFRVNKTTEVPREWIREQLKKQWLIEVTEKEAA